MRGICKGQEVIPYFTVQITLKARGYPKTVNATYKVDPKTHLRPLQMTEVAASQTSNPMNLRDLIRLWTRSCP